MGEEKSGSITSWVGAVKWLTLGVVFLTAMFLFKDEIRQLLGRTDSIEVSGKGLKIQTAKTLLGNVEVSNVTDTAYAVKEEGIQGGLYISHQNNFLITWPESSGWNASTTMGISIAQNMGLPSTVTIPLVITQSKLVDGIHPNVNVVMEYVGDISINDYMANVDQIFQQQGWQVLSKDIDERTQGGFISFYNNSSNKKLYQFQKVAISNGKAYVITASQIPPENMLSQQLKDELLSILNSFRTLSNSLKESASNGN